MPKGMRTLKNYTRHNVKGRGIIFAINKNNYKREFRIGQKFFADDAVWIITAIEVTWLLVYPKRQKPEIGLVAKLYTE